MAIHRLGHAANLLKVSVDTLRRYERLRFIVLGHRTVSDEQLEELRALRKGFKRWARGIGGDYRQQLARWHEKPRAVLEVPVETPHDE